MPQLVSNVTQSGLKAVVLELMNKAESGGGSVGLMPGLCSAPTAAD